jgi:nitrate reductase delta subunit
MNAEREIFTLYADLLDYPGEATARRALAGAELLAAHAPPAAPALTRFAGFAAEAGSARLEELYTATFDLNPLCFPYVGYQLCGEGRQRTLLLVRLQELYREHGFAAGAELPDHLTVVLRFLAAAAPGSEREALTADGLRPALAKMLAAFSEAGHPYAELLRSLRAFVGKEKTPEETIP